MTTPQPAALPELPRPFVPGDEFNPRDFYTADQMRAYALAALQSQPAAAWVSDDELRQAVDALRDPNTVSAFSNGYYTLTPGELRRVILALRPQAESEPFGYFRATPDGWEDCSKHDEGAKALYERPQAVPMTDWARCKVCGIDRREEGCKGASAFQCPFLGITAQGAQGGEG